MHMTVMLQRFVSSSLYGSASSFDLRRDAHWKGLTSAKKAHVSGVLAVTTSGGDSERNSIVRGGSSQLAVMVAVVAMKGCCCCCWMLKFYRVCYPPLEYLITRGIEGNQACRPFFVGFSVIEMPISPDDRTYKNYGQGHSIVHPHTNFESVPKARFWTPKRT